MKVAKIEASAAARRGEATTFQNARPPVVVHTLVSVRTFP